MSIIPTPPRGHLLAAFALFAGAAQMPALAFDYPTSDRVVFVQACMRDNPGPHYEMLNKCSCALDKIASDVPFDDFVDMNTATNANSIGGERGNAIRDAESLQTMIRKYRKIQADAKQSCLFGSTGPR